MSVTIVGYQPIEKAPRHSIMKNEMEAICVHCSRFSGGLKMQLKER